MAFYFPHGSHLGCPRAREGTTPSSLPSDTSSGPSPSYQGLREKATNQALTERGRARPSDSPGPGGPGSRVTPAVVSLPVVTPGGLPSLHTVNSRYPGGWPVASSRGAIPPPRVTTENGSRHCHMSPRDNGLHSQGRPGGLILSPRISQIRMPRPRELTCPA